jgi:hypothetical protein
VKLQPENRGALLQTACSFGCEIQDLAFVDVCDAYDTAPLSNSNVCERVLLWDTTRELTFTTKRHNSRQMLEGPARQSFHKSQAIQPTDGSMLITVLQQGHLHARTRTE